MFRLKKRFYRYFRSPYQLLRTNHVVFQSWITVGQMNVQPGWFTCVMGTGIVALCVTKFPFPHPLLHAMGSLIWCGAILMFLLLLILWGLRTCQAPHHLVASLHHPLQAQQWGSPPTACFTLATGFLAIGCDLIDLQFCLISAQILWMVGLFGCLFSSLAVPYLMFTKHELSIELTYGNWLIPIAPVIGASIPGSLLLFHWPRAWHADLLLLHYVLWGSGIALAAIISILFYARLAYHKERGNLLVPTMWLVLGPVGQSIVGLNALGEATMKLLPDLSDALSLASLLYSIPVWGVGVYWLLLTAMITLRAVRLRLPFSLSWWAFIYPVGVFTIATYTLHQHLPTLIFRGCSVLFLCVLAALWAMVSVRTLRQVRDTLVMTK